MEEESLQQSRSVGVVIPAFNEAENLPQVLTAVCSAGWVREIIVVDDGSHDRTLEVTQGAAERDRRVLAVHLPENRGKAAAMLTGVQALHTDLVIFLDADLVGLKPHHLEELTHLQQSGSREMALAVFEIGLEFFNVPQRLIPQLSGQRCLWRLEAEQALLPLVMDRYGVETGLTIHAKQHHWVIRKIVWRGVTHHAVWQKQEVAAGLQNRLQMYWQIMNVITRNRYENWRELPPVRLSEKFRFTPRR